MGSNLLYSGEFIGTGYLVQRSDGIEISTYSPYYPKGIWIDKNHRHTPIRQMSTTYLQNCVKLLRGTKDVVLHRKLIELEKELSRRKSLSLTEQIELMIGD